MLTNGTDVATASVFTAGQVYTPGGDDRINSLQDEDQLTGTAGLTDRIDATLGNANDNGATIITPKLTGIEVINVAFTGSSGGGTGSAVTALDLQDATGQTEVNITRISQATNTAEVGNIMTTASKLSLANTNANMTGTAEFSYGAALLKGLNEGDLTVNNVQIGTLNVGENTSGIAARNVGVNGFETLNLTSFGAAANTIGTLNLPMDTGTAGKVVIKGSANLTLGSQANVFNNPQLALVEAAGIWNAGSGIAQAGGRIAAIDASAFTGNLSIVLDGILDIGKADTSGVLQNVTVTGGSGNDTFVLYDAVQAGDSIDGGAGTDMLQFNNGSSIASVAAGIEGVVSLLDGYNDPTTAAVAVASSIDFDFLPAVAGITLRNISHSAVSALAPTDVNATGGVATFTLYDMTPAQAAAITIQHSTTGNNSAAQNVIAAAVKANTAADLVGVTIAEGFNVDPRFNFTLGTTVANTSTSTTAGASTIESITLTDSDTESNTVNLTNVAQHTGTITLTGGLAGTFLNLDATTGGLTNIDISGAATGDGFLNTATTQVRVAGAKDLSTTSTTKLVAATINAGGEASDVTVRVSTNAASVVGAQAITMGSGNDTVIFDNVDDTRAGLTISDTVIGGTGSDTLVIDGNLTVAGVVSLSASEWTNVSGFETVRLITPGAGSTYRLVLTDALIAANNANGVLAFVNDNDSQNDTSNLANVALTADEVSAVLDGRTLGANSHFSYNGEEGTSATADRFILSDANINGGNIIDGGAASNNDGLVATAENAAIDKVAGATYNANAAGPGNADVMEVRNAAIVTTGDLANLKNIGTLSFTNDIASVQTSYLQLNDTVVDAMVNSYHTASATAITGISQTETLYVNSVDNTLVAGAFTTLNVDASALTAKSGLNITASGGADTIVSGAGADFITGGAGVDTITTGGGADIVLYSALGQGGAALAGNAAVILAAGDTIVDFVSGTDRIDVTAGDTTAAGAAGASGAWNLGTAGLYVITGSALNYVQGTTTAANVATAIGNVNSVGDAVGYVAILDDQGDGSAGAAAANDTYTLFEVSLVGGHDGAAVAATDTISVVGVINSTTLLATDFIA